MYATIYIIPTWSILDNEFYYKKTGLFIKSCSGQTSQMKNSKN